MYVFNNVKENFLTTDQNRKVLAKILPLLVQNGVIWHESLSADTRYQKTSHTCLEIFASWEIEYQCFKIISQFRTCLLFLQMVLCKNIWLYARKRVYFPKRFLGILDRWKSTEFWEKPGTRFIQLSYVSTTKGSRQNEDTSWRQHCWRDRVSEMLPRFPTGGQHRRRKFGNHTVSSFSQGQSRRNLLPLNILGGNKALGKQTCFDTVLIH